VRISYAEFCSGGIAIARHSAKWRWIQDFPAHTVAIDSMFVPQTSYLAATAHVPSTWLTSEAHAPLTEHTPLHDDFCDFVPFLAQASEDVMQALPADDSIELTFHVIYSGAHQIPTLCILGARSNGTPIHPAHLAEAFQRNSPALAPTSNSDPAADSGPSTSPAPIVAVSPLIHPVLGTLCVALHPCGGHRIFAPLTAAGPAAAAARLGSWINAVAPMIGCPGAPASVLAQRQPPEASEADADTEAQ